MMYGIWMSFKETKTKNKAHLPLATAATRHGHRTRALGHMPCTRDFRVAA